MLQFYISWKHQKNLGFLVFLGGRGKNGGEGGRYKMGNLVRNRLPNKPYWLKLATA